jgi:SnoaL-like domain
MTTSTAIRPDVPLFSVAGTFLEALAAQDFPRLTTTLTDTARLSALVPSGLKQWHGPEEIGATFRRWFGDVARFELVDAVMGEVGPRLHLRWRVRVQAARFGAGWVVVEQQVYADTGPDGRITRLFLLCSGFCPEAPEEGTR